MEHKDSQAVFIVWGAPGSGKTTFVRENLGEGDVVVDLDSIAAALLGNSSAHPDYTTVLPLVLAVRDTLYTKLEARVGSWKRAFVITSTPDENKADRLVDRLGAKCIYMDVSEEEVMSRIESDPLRPDKAEAKKLAQEWFYEHQLSQQITELYDSHTT